MKPDLPPISDLSVLITGATRGIGAGISEKLSSLGAKLTLGYIEHDQHALDLEAELTASNPNVTIFKGDLTDPSAVNGLVEHAVGKFGHVDALVSNMGPFLWRLVGEMSVGDWDYMVKANLSAHFYLV